MATLRIVKGRPALLFEGAKRHLVVTDLHIGFESSLAENKIFLGKKTVLSEIITKLTEIIEKHKPDDLILLGDIKSSINRITKTEWTHIPEFLKKISQKVETILIPGNHDGNISSLVPKGITLVSSVGLVLENSLFTHGHTMPSQNFGHVDKIIMGHIHPVFLKEESILNGTPVWISLKTLKEKLFSTPGQIEIIVIPSFNQYFYATKKREYKKSISPIIERVKKDCSAKVSTLDGTIIGDESMLQYVL